MKHIYLLLFLFFCSTVFGQRGKNGPLTVSSTIVVNEYTALTANAAIGNTSITVANSALNAHNRFSKNLAAGDLVMIIQMQGATINGIPNNQISTPNDSSWGAILNYNNCGNNEIREVLSVPNNNTIKLTCPLVNNYTSAGKVQVVRIPRYSKLTINNGGEIICDAWDSVSGGIIAIEDLGNTVINAGGQINAYSSGFRGGALINSNSIQTNISYFASNQPNEYGAEKGEGIAGNGNDYNQFGGSVCMGAPANGGGGGDSWNAGGGGGANGGNVSGWINGFGIPDISQPGYITAWNEEYTWMSSFVGAGGGRGGYTWSGSVLDPLTVPPGNAGWGGDSRRPVGGRGGRPLDYSAGRLFFGGGGGAGSEDNNDAGNGGNGGGMIYFISFGTVSGNGIIVANGHNGVSDTLLPGDGPGGAGAGGTIVINSTGIISGITVEANGGTGGNQLNTAPEGEGPGGGGSGGYIATSNNITRIVNGGPNGTTTTLPTFPANGSTKGGPGDTASVTNFIIIAKNDTICPKNTAILNATLLGNVPPGTTIEWYDSITGGTLLGSGPTYTTPILTKTTVFYVSTCPGFYRQPDTVFVKEYTPSVSSAGDSICKGDTALLIASGGSSYLWSTNQTTDTIKVAPLSTTTYTLTAYYKGCSGDTTITVFVRPPVTATTHAVPDTVCPLGLSTVFVIPAGEKSTYKWSTGGTYDTIHVHPAVTTSYTVHVYGICDTTQQIIKVYVEPFAKPVITGTPVKCSGVTDTLHVSGGTSYMWDDGSTSVIYITGPIYDDSTVRVTAYNSIGCPHDTIFKITIRTLNVVTVAPAVACTGSMVTLKPVPETPGMGVWNYKWSPGGVTSDSITVNDSTAINYTLTISNASGCIEEVKTSVTPYNPPLVACCNKVILRGDDTIMVAHGSSIKSYGWSPEVTCLNPPLCDSVKVSPTVTTAYTVVGTDGSGCLSERVITIVVDAPCFNFVVPNVFTPTSPGIYGLNNVFYIKTMNLSSWSILIYDRWGKEMFKSSNPVEYWDGNAEGGGQAPAGVYYYIINGTCQNNTYKMDGFVQLIR